MWFWGVLCLTPHSTILNPVSFTPNCFSPPGNMYMSNCDLLIFFLPLNLSLPSPLSLSHTHARATENSNYSSKAKVQKLEVVKIEDYTKYCLDKRISRLTY